MLSCHAETRLPAFYLPQGIDEYASVSEAKLVLGFWPLEGASICVIAQAALFISKIRAQSR